MDNALPGTEKSKTFSITSAAESTVAVKYAISLEIADNDFDASSNDLVYSLTPTSEESGEITAITNKVITGGSKDQISIGTGTIGPGAKTHSYKFTIRFREMGSDQNSNQGKTFAGSLKVTTSGENGSDLYYTSESPNGTPTQPSSDDASEAGE